MGKKQGGQLKITERALIQRINRKLKQEGAQLRAARSLEQESSAGRYFIVDAKGIRSRNVDLEKTGRDLGAIRAWEKLEC